MTTLNNPKHLERSQALQPQSDQARQPPPFTANHLKLASSLLVQPYFKTVLQILNDSIPPVLIFFSLQSSVSKMLSTASDVGPRH